MIVQNACHVFFFFLFKQVASSQPSLFLHLTNDCLHDAFECEDYVFIATHVMRHGRRNANLALSIGPVKHLASHVLATRQVTHYFRL